MSGGMWIPPTPNIRVLVTGSRHWSDPNLIERAFIDTALEAVVTLVIHGDCQGADRMAASAAQRRGIPAVAYPADWRAHGLSAGPIRNRVMLDLKPELVLAFHDDIENSRGTKDCVDEAVRRGMFVRLYTHKVAGPLRLVGRP